MRSLVSLVCAVILGGCPSSHDPTDSPDARTPIRRDGGADGLDTGRVRRDAGPCEPLPATDEVDLLFMIDNSSSMGEEQASLVEQVPRLVRMLMTGDRDPTIDADGDGIPDDDGDDFARVGSLQVGVVTSDMGVGGFNVMTCNDEPNFGEDGVLRTTGNTAIVGCMAAYPSFLHLRGSAGAAQFARDVACVSTTGTGGCGFEQPLESVLKALTPSTCADPWCTFAMGTRGHADGANTGFLRPGSILALVVLTDEEDCSAADSELFNRASTRYSGELNLRCFLNPTAVHPISRYVEGLLATRRSSERVVFSVIAGMPPSVSTDSATYGRILALPEMQEEIDPTMMNRMRPSCNVAGRGIAFPPRRILEVAAGLGTRGAYTSAHSICALDFTPAIDALVEDLGESRRPVTCD